MLVTDSQDFLPSFVKRDRSLRRDTAKIRIWGSGVRISPGAPVCAMCRANHTAFTRREQAGQFCPHGLSIPSE
jgi:hypothetical protein